LASGYQAMAERPAGFALLARAWRRRPSRRAVSGVRCTLHHHAQYAARAKIERRRFEFVMMPPYCGLLEPDVRHVLLMTLRAAGVLA